MFNGKSLLIIAPSSDSKVSNEDRWSTNHSTWIVVMLNTGQDPTQTVDKQNTGEVDYHTWPKQSKVSTPSPFSTEKSLFWACHSKTNAAQ